MRITGSKQKQSKFIQITKVPIKILCKARDVYVKGMLSFSGDVKAGYGSAGIGGGVARLPKSFSVNSSMEVDEEELRRFMSKKESEIGSCMEQDGSGMKRSYIVGVGQIGKIDEDKACSFRADFDVNNMYLRSKSRAVRRKIVYH